MIEIEDLRIGNKILFDSEIDSVVSIYSRGVDGEFKSRWSSDRLHGIKLTPEILDKINWGGYIKFNIGSYFKIDDVGHLYYRSDYSGVNIDYLHQLQNLYYLLRGIELEIVW